jgi:hypothetical protein
MWMGRASHPADAVEVGPVEPRQPHERGHDSPQGVVPKRRPQRIARRTHDDAEHPADHERGEVPPEERHLMHAGRAGSAAP